MTVRSPSSAPRKPSARRSKRLIGRTQPRLFTPPLRRLTPRTTLGFAAIEFATTVLGITLAPWQQWWLKHALELKPDGNFRFRTVITLVARQNGKTTMLMVLTLFMLYMGHAKLVLGTAQNLDIAKESWNGAVQLAQGNEELATEIFKVREANGEQELKLSNGARYKIAAATRRAGRSLSIDLAILDELREQVKWDAWSALSKTTMARHSALTVGISNAGDADSVVLNHLREVGLSGRDVATGLFEWSAPQGCDLFDRNAWAAANPSLGHDFGDGVGITAEAIESAARSDPASTFRTEVLCQTVDALDEAVSSAGWEACKDPAGTMDSLREHVVTCIDVAPDGGHVTLAAAAPDEDGRVRVEIVEAWGSTTAARADLPALLERIQPKLLAWYPAGPAAALATLLRKRSDVVELNNAKACEASQSFADLVAARGIIHPGDPLLDAHVAGAKRYHVGEGWRFVRRGAGHVDAAYAAAGAVHTVLTEPEPVPQEDAEFILPS